MIRPTQIQLILLTLVLAVSSACDSAGTSPAPAPPAANTPAPTQRTAANPTIRFLEERVRRDPEDFVAQNKLVGEYLQVLRESGDSAYLELARRAAEASLAALPAAQNKGGLAAMIRVQFSSHDFVEARDNAKRLIDLEPNREYPYQFYGDALLELGAYDEGSAAFLKMEELAGGQGMIRSALEQRLARIAFLRGDNGGAAKHMTAALRAVESMPEPHKETVAFCQWQLGETAFAAGDHRGAEKFYRLSLATYPDYFRSLSSMGRVRAAQGDMAQGIEFYEKAVRILPDIYFVAALGDLYRLTGREQDAADQYALVEKIGQLSAAGGSLYNRALAMFYADHDLKVEEAYAMAQREYETRRDIYGADALAWTALKAGKAEEAKAAMAEALKLGTKDAKLYYHAGMIENALGNRTEAKRFLDLALKINPGFDPLQSSIARQTLEALK